MSERSELAVRIAKFIIDNNLANPFGGDVEKSGRYYATLFSVPRLLDGLIRVYSPKFILIECQGRLVNGNHRAVYENENDAIAFLREAFVNHNQEAAFAIPTKPKNGEAA